MGQDAEADITVVFSRDAAPYRQALKGFEEVLQAAGQPYRLQRLYLDGDLPHDRVIQRIRSKTPALILTIGSGATTLISGAIGDVPIVFSLVQPSAGTAALRAAPGHPNLTGSSMEIPVEVQFREIRGVLPRAKRIGVLYDPEVTGKVVEAAAAGAASMGMDLVPMSVRSEGDLMGHADALAEVDALWSVADSTVFSPQGLNQILLSTLRHRVPFVGLSPSFVKAGALLALSVDYTDVGRQSAELARRVLAGEKPSDLPATTPRKVSLSVNLNTARQIDVAIGDDIRQKAQLFF
jgi:putative ABC transport system substrate-binding protein